VIFTWFLLAKLTGKYRRVTRNDLNILIFNVRNLHFNIIKYESIIELYFLKINEVKFIFIFIGNVPINCLL